MNDQQKPDRPQTLLEAAKAVLLSHSDGSDWGRIHLAGRNLREAIAREEAHPSTDARIDYEYGRATFWQIKASEANDRAQQAEADAKWHKAESERLSEELALARNQLTLAVERSERLSGQLAGCHYDLGEARKQRQRAEKAEAELAEVAERSRARLGESARWKARAEEAEAALAKPQQSHPMDGGDITVMLNRAGVAAWGKLLPHGMTTTQRVECLIGEWKQLKVEVSNLERTRDALLDVMKKQKAEAMDAINLLAKVIGGDS